MEHGEVTIHHGIATSGRAGGQNYSLISVRRPSEPGFSFRYSVAGVGRNRDYDL